MNIFNQVKSKARFNMNYNRRSYIRTYIVCKEVGIATGYKLDYQGIRVRPPVWYRTFSSPFLHTGSGWASVILSDDYSGVKAAGT
jgi:hypothetical protein